ncbi:MAG: SLC13 family permease [Bacteroidota bacterium]
MFSPAVLTLLITLGAVVLFVTEWLSVDVVAMLLIIALVLTGVISVEEGLAGFSNEATLTVAFMFVLSAALLKTGALQQLAQQMSGGFRAHPLRATFTMMLLVAVTSAFINNTPVVAVFIPIVGQIAATTGIKASRLLIPLSFASILGGMCTLLGTSTNLLVHGIAQNHGLPGFSMFTLAPVAAPILLMGLVYVVYLSYRLLPNQESEKDLKDEFALHDYLAEFVLLESEAFSGRRIMDSPLVRELDMDIIEVRRGQTSFNLPPGDFRLQTNDTLKVRCDREKIKALKDYVRLLDRKGSSGFTIMGTGLGRAGSTLVELVVTPNSSFVGRTLRQVDFRRAYRGVPLAIRQREATLREKLYRLPLTAGDVILAEVKTHYLSELKRIEQQQDSPFILLSTDSLPDFKRSRFVFVMAVIFGVVFCATAGLLPIVLASLCGLCALVIGRTMNMTEVYEAINWRVVFLLAGALSLGTAMANSGLDTSIAAMLSGPLHDSGPFILVGGLYLLTNILTELMSNNATAALLAPIAIAVAHQTGVDPMPLLVTVALAASASFLSPVGYQTNAMVYSAGRYKFRDFGRVGIWLSLICLILTTLLVPLLFDM